MAQGAAIPPTEMPIQVVVNGAIRDVAAGTTIAGLLDLLDIATAGVAVERNRKVVRRADHRGCVIADGDRIEIVRFVGGG